MRRFATVPFALVLTAGLIAGCGEDSADTDIGSDEASYEVDLPEGWSEASEDQQELVARNVGAQVESVIGEEVDTQGAVVTSYFYRGDFEAIDEANVLVIREPIPGGASEDQFVEASIGLLEQALGTAVTEPVTEAEAITVDGVEAPSYDYAVNLQGIKQAKRVVFVIRDEISYTVTITGPVDDADSVFAAFDAMAASWQFSG